MVCVDVLLTCHLFHKWACVFGSMMKHFLNPCNTLEGKSVHFADILYFLYRDKHHHYFSYLTLELITNPVFTFNFSHPLSMIVMQSQGSPYLTLLSLLGHGRQTGVSAVSRSPCITECMHSTQFCPFYLVPKQMC